MPFYKLIQPFTITQTSLGTLMFKGVLSIHTLIREHIHGLILSQLFDL